MFGQPASTGFSFGSTSTPAFGAASSTAAFGASSAPAFGAPAASAATGFGAATSTPAFGATTNTPAFGASSTTAFNFSSTPALGFGGSTPAFGAASAPAFGQSAAQPAFGGFGQPAAQQQQQQQQQVPFVRSTQFEQVAPNVQTTLQQIQSQISTYDASRLKVQQLPHLQESPASQQGLDAEIQSAWGDLKELSGMMKAHEGGLQDFKEKSNQLLKAADVVVQTYGRNKQWREHMMRGEGNPQQHMTLPVMLPGPYLEEAVQGMSQTVAEFSRVLDEVEQVLASSSLQDPTQVDWRTVLPTIVSNMHDYFIAVAAKLERTHTEVERLKPMYLARLREQGIYTDPFERARRQEQLQQQQQQQQQQQRPSAAAAAGQQQSTLSAGAQPGGLLALPAPAGGGMFGAQTPAGPAPQGTPGIGSFGSPFPASTPLGASPFGGAPNSGLSRSNTGKPKSKKR